MNKQITVGEWVDSQSHEFDFWAKQLARGNDEQMHRFDWYTKHIFGSYFWCVPWEEQCVLEIGSGPYGVASRLPCLHKVAMDPLMDMFASIGYDTKLNHTTPVCCSAEDMLNNSVVTGYSYDHILCFNCLDHCRDPEWVLRNINSLMLDYTQLWLVCDMRPAELIDVYHKIRITKEWMDIILDSIGLCGKTWLVPHQTGNPTIQYCAILRRK